MKLSSIALQFAILLGGRGGRKSSIIVHAGVCTEMSINPVETDVNMNACLSRSLSGSGQCGVNLDDVVSNDQCTKFSDFFGSNWQLLNDVTEQMADPNDETKGRLPVYGKMIGGEMLYLYYTLDGAAQGKRNADGGGGRWVFGRTIGSGYGVDFGQARCGCVPNTCLSWGFGVNTGGKCSSPVLEKAVYGSQDCTTSSSDLNPSNHDSRLPYQRDDLSYSMINGGYSTKIVRVCPCSQCGCSNVCRLNTGTNGDGVTTSAERDITFDFECISSDPVRTISYEAVSGVPRRPCLAEYSDFANADGDYEFDTFDPWAEDLFPPDGEQDSAFVTDDCRISRCQGSPQEAGSQLSAVPYSERDCLDPSHYWETCGCNTPGWVHRNITINGKSYNSGNFEIGSIMDDPTLDLGPSPSTTTVATTTTEGTTTSTIVTTIASTSTTTTSTTQAMGICVNAGSMDGESCPDAAACACTRRNLLDHEELEVDDQDEEEMEDIKSNLRQRGLQRGCKCQPNRGKFCCPNAGETCESDGVCRASTTTTLPVTTIGSTTTVPQTTSTTAQAVCTCEFGTTSTESPPATTTTTLPPPQTSTTASSCAPAGAKCQEVSRCCNGCQDSGRKADRQCL